ncbi:cytokine receptor common subunit beta [Pimephales promelas]|uniref:cytokine receptor common subunit beta n=1 Tax=Pimephales promelas TaxID=90988 RepID=UPI001955A03C|nr:cytokine receptor common subunit beta [Pimephales promelas]XP_039543215.1 cytokine receptor common subunit beta [Pimephales promelas]XP_039543216.1 cytokine receptor common subunit beta [Pimephales promelas]KAG1967305.1 cytokine receptor common subunit beta [Pimephales promelas]KAG1967306.1 cytokine receptor common subunit beta [Pimephales promelas]KAG1967307.1 cytokine receptor common subunit beta [Pimephales promelas]
MFSTWILHMVSFTLLIRRGIGNQCPHYEVTPGKESPLMDSLQCYNDYKTYVQCKWEVDPQVTANKSIFELHYWDNIYNEILCDRLRPGVLLPNGKIFHECRFKTRRFTVHANHILYFKVPCNDSRATILKVAEHGKVKAPIDLKEMVADSGGHLLSWKSPYPASSNITRTLTYQLQYSGIQDWTIVDNINASEYMINKESLLPGNHYQARVRARGPVGLWSDWSPLVSWKTHDDGVFNLQCVIVGEKTVTCTWQMKTDHFELMSYHLWCRDSDKNEPSLCCKDPQLQSQDVELSEFLCSVNVSDPYLLTVELRPVLYSRTFRPSEHIKLSQPDQIQVMEEDGTYKFNWSEAVIPSKVEMQYSTQLKISNNISDPIIITLQVGVNNLKFPSGNLSSSTIYQAQIRLLPVSVEDNAFKIQPSDWSQPAEFTTKPVLLPTSFLIYILVPVFVVVLFIILYNALPACHRRIKLWNGSVPSPIKSKVLEGMIKKSPSGWPHIIEKETTSICVLLATDNLSICKSSDTWEPLLLPTEDVSLNIGKMGQSCGSNPLCTYMGKNLCKDKSGMNFSGPYILCCDDSCTQDKVLDGSTDRDQTSVLGKSESFAPINGGYVVTPPTAMPALQNSAPIESPNNNPSDEPPAYTPSPDQGCAVLPHPSGYFTMPCVAIQSEPSGSCGT